MYSWTAGLGFCFSGPRINKLGNQIGDATGGHRTAKRGQMPCKIEDRLLWRTNMLGLLRPKTQKGNGNSMR